MEARINHIKSSNCPDAKLHLNFAINKFEIGVITESELLREISECEKVVWSDSRWEKAKKMFSTYDEMIKYHDQ